MDGDSSSAAGLSVEQALHQPVEEMLPDAVSTTETISSSQTPTGPTTNGVHDDEVSQASKELNGNDVDEILEELRRTREERDGFESQYKGLLAKLTQMRTTLGDRLRRDAEELDHRESQIQTLTSQVEEMRAMQETLQSELLTSNGENERVTKELDALRVSSAAAIEEATKSAATAASREAASSQSLHQSERTRLEGTVQQLNQTVESLRMQLSNQQSQYQDERSRREELETVVGQHLNERQALEQEIQRQRELVEREKESSANLQMVLEEFQSEQETELQRALGDYQRKYDVIATQMEEFKEKARYAEKKYLESKNAAERVKILEQDVKEKNLLIGKLRHEAVILNEHLTEALRRLNRDNSDVNVDRRLVTNVVLQFLSTPRQDAKRFEMLNLLSSVLQWDDEERETAGIARAGTETGSRWRRVGVGAGKTRASQPRGPGQDESFSSLFVEYLLSEADKDRQRQQAGALSAPPTASNSTSPIASRARMTSPQTAPAGRSNFDMSQLGTSLASSRRTSGGYGQPSPSDRRGAESGPIDGRNPLPSTEEETR